MLLWMLLSGCRPELAAAPADPLPAHAPGRVLAMELTPTAAVVSAEIESPATQTVDLDAPEDDRDAFRYALISADGERLYERTTSGPMIVRSFLEHWSDESGIDLLAALPTLGRFPLVVPDLDGADRVVFELRDDAGDYVAQGEVSLDEVLVVQPTHPGVIGFETLHESGPSENRLDIVIVGDGYRESELGAFADHAATVRDRILDDDPLSHYADRINIHRVDVVSNESGASYDCEGECRIRDTAFGSIFAIEIVNAFTGSNYSTRAIFQAFQWDVAAAISVVPWDHVIVLVNSDRYGGMAIHYATATAGQPQFGETAVHELGHALGLLGDEYVADDCIRSDALGLPVNVTDDPGRPPWADWIDDGTPLPTTDADDGIGAFAGAYNCPDLYRPADRCKMKGSGPFCDVCSEQLVKRIFRYSDPVGDVTLAPSKRGFVLTGSDTTDDAEVSFTLDGEPLGDGVGPGPFDIDADEGELVVTWRESSGKVRGDAFGDLESKATFQIGEGVSRR